MKYSFPAIIPVAIEKVTIMIIGLWSRIRTPMLCWIWGVKIGKGVIFQGKTYIRSRGYGIEIGDNVVFNSLSMSNLVGLTNATILENRAGGRITIRNNCGFSSVVMSSKSSISIGNRVLMGGNARIYDHDYHSLDCKVRGTAKDYALAKTKSVIIEDDVFIGTNVIILKGTRWR